jgi:hypothetical protein
MSNEEIKEKYGIVPIMKKMWVWHDNIEDAFFCLVVCKDCKYEFPYLIIEEDGGTNYYKHASETNPNEPKKPKRGDMGYFWDDEEVSYTYGKLQLIDILDPYPYLCEGFSWHQHFSHEKQPWMK